MNQQSNLDLDDYFARVERNAFIPEPPKNRIFIGDGEFRKIGCDMARGLIKAVNLQPASAVLDIGSGIGRLALPSTQWLNETGIYVGIEIVMEGVSWCQENITSRYPNFRFIHADIHNEYYNPTGQRTAAGFAIPADAGLFDVAAFFSVFTHMAALDSDAWLGQVARALKPGGQVFSTWFSMDEETISNCLIGKTTIGLNHEENGVFWQSSERNPVAVGYAPRKMREMFDRHGLRVTSWSRGSWCQRAKIDWGFQDQVRLIKE